MKKVLASVLALCMLMTFASFPAMAETTNPHRVKIFTIGDSFTAGVCEPNAYRYYIYEPLIKDGGVFEFIGPNQSGDWRVTDMYKKHGGVGGAVIGVADDYTWNGSSWGKNAWSVTTDNGITISSAGNLNNIHYRLFAGSDGSNDYTKTEYGNYVAQADIVTLYIGLNDYYSTGATGRSADIEFVKDSYRTLVDRIFEINPDVHLYVISLNEVSSLRGLGLEEGETGYENSVHSFNKFILEEIVTEYEGKYIQSISLNQDGYKMDESTDTPSDESHPNDKGNKKIGTQIYMGIKDDVLALNAQGSDVAYNPTRVTGISIDKTSANLQVGENLTITSTITPSTAEVITTVFSSSNESVATVDQYGRVTAVGAGTATIYATALDSMRPGDTEIKAACNVIVSSDTYEKVDADYPRVFSDRLNDKTKWTGSTTYVSEDGAAYKHSGTSTSSITSTEKVSLDYKFSMAFDLAVIGAETKEVNDTNRSSYYTALTIGKYQLRVGINGRVVAFYYDGVKKGEKVFGTPVTRQNKDRYTLVKDGATVYVYRNNEVLFTATVDENETVEANVVLSCNGTNTQNVRDIEVKSTYGLKKLSPTIIYASTNTTNGNTRCPASNMIDNDIKTRYTVYAWKNETPVAWDSAHNYVILDLGAEYDVSNLDIYWGAQGGAWGNSMPDAYSVSYSSDNVTYTPALSYQGLINIVTGAATDTYSDSNTSLTAKYQSGKTGNDRIIFSYGNVKEAELGWTGVRYIKIQMSKIVYNPSIAEIEVFTTGYAEGEEPDGTTTYYTVKYVDKNGKDIYTSKRVNGKTIGTEVTEEAVEVDGYTPDKPSQTITLQSSGNVITFTYSREYTGVPEAIVPDSVTTDMTAVSGEIADIIDGISKSAGSPYWNYFRSNIPQGDGTTVLGNVVFDFGENNYYNLTEIWFNMGGCYMKYGKLYGSNSTSDPTSSAWTELQEFNNLTFTAVDASDSNKGQELTQEIVHPGYYRYFKLEIKGLSKSTGLVWLESTFMGCEGEATADEDKQEVAYTVKCIDEDDTLVYETNGTGIVGETITVTAPEIDGYEATEESKPLTLVDAPADNVITFTYTKITADTPVKIIPVGVNSPFGTASGYSIWGLIDGNSTSGNSYYYRASVKFASTGEKYGEYNDGENATKNFNFTVDFGYSYKVTRFKPTWGGKYATKVALWGSDDNKTWKLIGDFTGTASAQDHTVTDPGYYRYVKVEAYSILENNDNPACLDVSFEGVLHPNAIPSTTVKVTTNMENSNDTLKELMDGIAYKSAAPDYNYFTSEGKNDGGESFGSVVFGFTEPKNLTEIWFNMGSGYITGGKLYASNSISDPDAAGWTDLNVNFDNLEFTAVKSGVTAFGNEATATISHDGYYKYFKVEITSVATDKVVWLETFFRGKGENAEEPDDNIVAYTVKCIDEDDTLIYETNGTGIVGKTITVTAPEIDGYEATEESKPLTLVDAPADNVITFTYTKSDLSQPTSLMPFSVTSTLEALASNRPVNAIINGTPYASEYNYFASLADLTTYNAEEPVVQGSFVFTFDKPVKLSEIEFIMGVRNMKYGELYGSNITNSLSSETGWESVHTFENLAYTPVSSDGSAGRTNTQTIDSEKYYRYYKIDVTGISEAGQLVWLESYFTGVEKDEEIDSLGATIRFEEDGVKAGIRFHAKVDKALAGIEGKYAYAEDAEVKFGMFLLPQNMLGDTGTLAGYLEAQPDGEGDALDIPAKRIWKQDAETLEYTAVLIGIPQDEWSRDIVAVPYMIKNGKYTYYSEMTKSYKGVAGTALATTYNPNTITAMADSPEKTALREISYKLQYIQRGYDKPYTEQGERILAKLKRGINMQGLDASSWSSWDSHIRTVTSSSSYQNIKSAGFDHVRIPVDFRNAADSNGNLNTSKMTTYVDKAVDAAIGQGLVVFLDFHGWSNIMLEDFDYFVTVWTNLATYYKDKYPENLIFELVNEPHTAEESDGDGGDLNLTNLVTLQTRTVDAIRAIDPDRFICLATSGWNGIWTLKDKDIGSASMFRNTPLMNYQDTIVALHCYTPGEFTHQDMSWAGTGGQTYSWSDNQEAYEAAIKEELGYLVEFVEETGMHAVLNEFGCNTGSSVSDADEAAYAKTVVSCIKDNDKIAYTWWEYEQSFGMTSNGSWKTHILNEIMAE